MNNNKFHKIISYIKSGVRLIGSITSVILICITEPVYSLLALSIAFTLGEILGILEEVIGTD